MGSSADSLKVAADKLNDSELFDKDVTQLLKLLNHLSKVTMML